MIPHMVCALSLALPPLAARADGAAEVSRLVKQLGSDDFWTREAASKRLKEIGAAALPALRRAASDGDTETRRRAEEAVAAIVQELYGEQALAVGHGASVLIVFATP